MTFSAARPSAAHRQRGSCACTLSSAGRATVAPSAVSLAPNLHTAVARRLRSITMSAILSARRSTARAHTYPRSRLSVSSASRGRCIVCVQSQSSVEFNARWFRTFSATVNNHKSTAIFLPSVSLVSCCSSIFLLFRFERFRLFCVRISRPSAAERIIDDL